MTTHLLSFHIMAKPLEGTVSSVLICIVTYLPYSSKDWLKSPHFFNFICLFFPIPWKTYNQIKVQLFNYQINLQSNIIQIFNYHINLLSNIIQLFNFQINLQTNIIQLFNFQINLQSNIIQIFNYHINLQSNIIQLFNYHINLQSNMIQIFNYQINLHSNIIQIFNYHINLQSNMIVHCIPVISEVHIEPRVTQCYDSSSSSSSAFDVDLLYL